MNCSVPGTDTRKRLLVVTVPEPARLIRAQHFNVVFLDLVLADFFKLNSSVGIPHRPQKINAFATDRDKRILPLSSLGGSFRKTAEAF